MRDGTGYPSPRRSRNEAIEIGIDVEMPAGPVHPGLGRRMRIQLGHCTITVQFSATVSFRSTSADSVGSVHHPRTDTEVPNPPQLNISADNGLFQAELPSFSFRFPLLSNRNPQSGLVPHDEIIAPSIVSCLFGNYSTPITMRWLSAL